jgi:hypothetical protein
MPSGKGTYGNKVGRPKKQKECSSCKGMKSKTHKGDMDYTTKKGDKDFHQKDKDVKKKRSPYQAFVSKHRKAGKSMKEIGAMWRKTKKK